MLSERKIDSGHCIKLQNKYYKFINGGGKQIFLKLNSKAIVIKAFNNKLYASVNDRVFILEEMINHEYKSKNFDMDC